MTDGINLRELALDMLLEIMEKGGYSHLVLREVLDKYGYLEKQERAFLTRLTEGTIERTIELDAVLNRYSKIAVSRMKPLIRNLLRLSVYQLRCMDNVPDSAVCNEAVKLAKKRGFGQLSGFVNGVLRSVARSKEEAVYPPAKQEPASYLEIRYSMPRWIVEEWMNRYGFEKTESILKSFYEKRALTIRTNLQKITPDELEVRLTAKGVKVTRDDSLSYAMRLEGLDRPDGLEEFQEGAFYVQDVSSMMAAEAAEPKENSYILDVCAAPGGKSIHLAEMLRGHGTVRARDLTQAKVDRINENIMRQGLSNITAEVWDATVLDPDSVQKADLVVCDLPCSGLGVLRRKPDIRYKMTKEKQMELAKLQRKILDTVCRYVKPQGTLLYSTCTISELENEENTAWLLREHPEFSVSFMRQILPDENGQDGFFIAKLTRD